MSFNKKIREVLEDFDLEPWLEQYVTLKSGGQPSERTIETCPKCGNSNYKLYVNVYSNLWICHVCDWGRQGKLIDLLCGISGKTELEVYKEIKQTVTPAPSTDFVDRLQIAFTSSVTEDKPLELVPIPGIDTFTGIVANYVCEYVKSRGLSNDDMINYYLRMSVRLLHFSGPFVVFPILYRGAPVGWQGRSVKNTEPKYVSSSNIGNWMWPIDTKFVDRIGQEKWVVLVEGVFDAAALWRLHVPALCTFGKKISDKQIRLLQQIGVKVVMLMWDADAAVTSIEKRMRGTFGLRGEIEQSAIRLQRTFRVKVVDLSNPPEFKDVDKPDPGAALVSQDVAHWLCNRMSAAIDVSSTEFFQWRMRDSRNI